MNYVFNDHLILILQKIKKLIKFPCLFQNISDPLVLSEFHVCYSFLERKKIPFAIHRFQSILFAMLKETHPDCKETVGSP